MGLFMEKRFPTNRNMWTEKGIPLYTQLHEASRVEEGSIYDNALFRALSERMVSEAVGLAESMCIQKEQSLDVTNYLLKSSTSNRIKFAAIGFKFFSDVSEDLYRHIHAPIQLLDMQYLAGRWKGMCESLYRDFVLRGEDLREKMQEEMFKALFTQPDYRNHAVWAYNMYFLKVIEELKKEN